MCSPFMLPGTFRCYPVEAFDNGCLKVEPLLKFLLNLGKKKGT